MIHLPLFPISDDSYRCLAAPAQGEYRAKGSRFLAYAYAVDSPEAVKQQLEALKKEHFKATHWCYAYRLGLDGQAYRANDDGEPGGSAGKPILNQIDSFQLRDCLIVVVRYYGGVKLGVPGLREAYKMASLDALQQASIETRIAHAPLLLKLGYAQLNELMNWLKQEGLEISQSEYGAEQVHIRTAVRLSRLHELAAVLEAWEGLEAFSS